MVHSRLGLWYGLLGVVIFSFTLPATRLAVQGGLSPVLVGLGRAVVASVFAGVTLAATGAKFPGRAHWTGLAGISANLVIAVLTRLNIVARQDDRHHFSGWKLGLLAYSITCRLAGTRQEFWRSAPPAGSCFVEQSAAHFTPPYCTWLFAADDLRGG